MSCLMSKSSSSKPRSLFPETRRKIIATTIDWRGLSHHRMSLLQPRVPKTQMSFMHGTTVMIQHATTRSRPRPGTD